VEVLVEKGMEHDRQQRQSPDASTGSVADGIVLNMQSVKNFMCTKTEFCLSDDHLLSCKNSIK